MTTRFPSLSPMPDGPIVAAGLSPAWQVIMQFAALRPGQVNRAGATLRCASGKVLNVAVALAHLRVPCRAVTVLGGPPAAATAAEFAELGIPLVAVPTAAVTRTCTTLLDEATGRTTELVENALPISAAEVAAFREAYASAIAAAAVVVLSGSLPAGTSDELYHDLLAATACPVVLDARGPELLAALPRRPLLVKPNREELGLTVGRRLESETAVMAAAEAVRALGAVWVLVTDGERPALLVGPEGRFRIVPPRVERVENPIGCGDCVAAGFAAAIASGRPPLEAIGQGFACAADNCGSLLAGRLDPDRVARFEAAVAIERL